METTARGTRDITAALTKSCPSVSNQFESVQMLIARKGLLFALMIVLGMAAIELLLYATGKALEAKYWVWRDPGPPKGATMLRLTHPTDV